MIILECIYDYLSLTLMPGHCGCLIVGSLGPQVPDWVTLDICRAKELFSQI